MLTALCRATVPGLTAALLLSGCAGSSAGGNRHEESLSDQKKGQRPTYQVIVRERVRKSSAQDATKD